jgi:di/tricarboxylate transporter
MKALLVLIIASLGAVALAIYASRDPSSGLAVALSREPTVILLSGGFLLGLGGVLRRPPV